MSRRRVATRDRALGFTPWEDVKHELGIEDRDGDEGKLSVSVQIHYQRTRSKPARLGPPPPPTASGRPFSRPVLHVGDPHAIGHAVPDVVNWHGPAGKLARAAARQADTTPRLGSRMTNAAESAARLPSRLTSAATTPFRAAGRLTGVTDRTWGSGG